MSAPTSSTPLIRPDQIDNLPNVTDEQKRQWKQGLTGLWSVYNSSPDGSLQKTEARNKIAGASGKIMQHLSQRNKPGTGSGAQRPPQAVQGGGQTGQAQAVQQGGQSQQPAQNQQQPAQPPQQAQQSQPSQQSQQSQQAQQVANNPTAQLQARVKQMVQKTQIYPQPGTTTNQQFTAYKESFQQRLGNSLLKRERAQLELTRLQRAFHTMQGQGTEVSDENKAKYAGVQRVVKESAEEVSKLEAENDQNKREYAQKQMKGQENGQAAGNTQANGGKAQSTSRPSTQQGQNNTGQGDVKMEQQPSNSPQQPQGQFPQQQQTQNVGTPAQHQTPQQMPQQHTQPSSTQPQNQGTPQNNTQSQHPPQNYPQNNMGQQPQPPRPQMNTQTPQQSQYGQQQYPNTAQPNVNAQPPNPNQRPQPLTQQAAMAQAAQSYSQAQQQQQQQQQPSVNQSQQPMQQPHSNMPNGLPFNAPHATNQQHTPTAATGFPPSQQINSQQTKFPIPKNLNLGPQTQTPVSGPPSRPTMMNQAGMLSVPGIQKPAPFTLEGEGDHVLSKRKLDELVRQITGSTSPSDNLSPEVEEAVLALTDNFVDNVVQKACQLAKLRQGQTLDVRDVQMVLERNYGIRIPGYSLDEVRTVRKFQPAPGWVGKVQAVQAGKVMGGSKDS